MNTDKKTDFPVVIVVTKTDGTRQRFGGVDPHSCKSLAGNEFRQKNVRSVYVGDVFGNPIFYRTKDERGHVIRSKNVDVESDVAQGIIDLRRIMEEFST